MKNNCAGYSNATETKRERDSLLDAPLVEKFCSCSGGSLLSTILSVAVVREKIQIPHSYSTTKKKHEGKKAATHCTTPHITPSARFI
mmetsp:Transcript_858/g.1985  ORF Transcript_858/g.1985 Transcript_858/m.1985 type:complete len:87 (+) Transcript_858:536-796(+)